MAQEPDADRRYAFEQLHGGCTSDESAGMLERLVTRLTQRNWQGPVVNSHVLKSTMPNAFVLAGGDVYVTQGLLDLTCSEDDLAAVLAHELGHLEDPTGFEVAGLTMTDRLEVEAEADRRAVMRLLDSGYDVTALLRMIDRLAEEQPPGWAEDRRARLEDLLGESLDADVPAVPRACDGAADLEEEL
jgi:predicted Zn-dependent protease